MSASEESIFAEAIKRTGGEREAFLREACGENGQLRAAVEGLLAAHEAGSFLDGAATLKASEVEQVGAEVGRYRLLEKLAEGGFGEVFVAEQREPIRRRVALKVIKRGMDTRQVVARFEMERQALALMEHPNIAKVLDAGETKSGRPYFVMELVRGMPITRYCDENQLSTEERLRLFMAVCQAIQHAHQKGIIHRDIKPSNVLVTLHDGKPVPKVIDFGIAKATQGDLTEGTVYTRFHQFIGTPAYISPEQAEMTGLDVDTRADIYSLGVLLYELLVGKTPFDGKELLVSGLDAMRRTIREQEPQRPSTRLASLSPEELTTTAKRRATRPDQLTGTLRRDVDWIVMKCLEKDRNRRYETATGLAQDVGRYLENQPVVARPPSVGYRVEKFVRRNRVAVTASVAMALVVLIAGGVALRERLKGTAAQREAIMATLRADAEKKRAESAAFLAEVSRVLTSIMAGVKLSHADEEQARKLAEKLASRVKTGEASESERELAVRFLARKFELMGSPIQALDSKYLGAGYWFDGTYLLPGLGVLLKPIITMDGQPLPPAAKIGYVGAGPDLTDSNIGELDVVNFTDAVKTAGIWEFSTVLEAQLVEAKGRAAQRLTAEAAEGFRKIGAPMRLAVAPRRITFLEQTPEGFPVEVKSDGLAARVAAGLSVSECVVTVLKEDQRPFTKGQLIGEVQVALPVERRALPFTLKVEFVKIGETPVSQQIQTLTVANGELGSGSSPLIPPTTTEVRDGMGRATIRFAFSKAAAAARPLEAGSGVVRIRSFRNGMLGVDLNVTAKIPEIEKSVVFKPGKD